MEVRDAEETVRTQPNVDGMRFGDRLGSIVDLDWR
jgi:hypothetical protein